MNQDFQNIDEYIALQDAAFQPKLQELRQIIREAAPPETQETIAYKMPTFRYNGNLIHFAQFKNHLGIYPGSEAIEKYEKELLKYKSSKGAIQFPNNQSLDKKLIQDIVSFNAEILANKKDNRWGSYREQWTELYENMSRLIEKTSLTKELKWGMDIYTHQGKNVLGWGGFKHFFSIWFYKGVFLTDPYGVLVAATEGKTKALRQWRLTSLEDFDANKILEYIDESVQATEAGKEIVVEKGTSKEITGILKVELQNNKELNAAFEKLTPGRQKEYITYIEEAKQEKTKLVRMEKIIPMILSKKGLHDKYKH